MGQQASKPVVTVLGASGLLGRAITRELASRPIRLRLASRRTPVLPPDAEATIEPREVDLTASGAVADVVAGSDAVIHLVAHRISGAASWRASSVDPMGERVNLGLVHDVIDVLRRDRAKRPPVLLLAGSMSQTGRSALPRIDGSEPDRPLTVYDEQKLAGEKAILAATEAGVLRGSSLRLATLFSQGTDFTGDDRGVVAAMMRRAFMRRAADDVARRLGETRSALRGRRRARLRPRARRSGTVMRPPLAGRHGSGDQRGGTVHHDRQGRVHPHRRAASTPVVSAVSEEGPMATDDMDFVLDPSAFQEAAGWSARVPLLEGLDKLAAAVARESALGSN